MGVTDPVLNNAAVTPGATFTLSVTVSNQGDTASAATTLRYYRSTDATISSSDTELATAGVPALRGGAGWSREQGLTAPASAGTYYFGACVDAVSGEAATTNNCSAAVGVTVVEEPAAEPDLIVTSASVSDSQPAPSGAFTLNATVSNQGDTASAATTLRYYRSTDATISSSDTELATAGVPALRGGAGWSREQGLTAPASAGTYYFGACVDAVSGEAATTNNCSAAVSVTVVEEPAAEPDLIVASASVSDTSPAAAAAFTLSVLVRNQGDTASSATTLRYYRSTDAAISTADTQVGTDALAALAAGAAFSTSASLTAPASAGTYYFGACVDAVSGEAATTNNCSAGVTVTVPAPAPDLIVASASVSDTSPAAGAAFTLSVSVRNQGEGASSATTLRYYRSTDATISTGDTQVGTDAVAALAAGASVNRGEKVAAPATPGTYYFGACVDAVSGEAATTNNCSSRVTVRVPAPAPDLIVASASVSDSSPAAGATFTLHVLVRNQGDTASAATTLRYYRSTDGTISSSDTELGTDAVAALGAGAAFSGSASLTAPASAGTYYFGACVDAVSGEAATTNNCSAAVGVTVVEEPAAEPDLIVTSASVSDSQPAPSGAFTLNATVSNQGDTASAATTLRFYRSTDATISTGDTQVGTDAVAALDAGASFSGSASLTAPASAGTYYFGACVDAVSGEAATTNNCSAGVTVTVPAPAPDLIVTSARVSDSSPAAGATFTLRATVSNQGEGASSATTLRYYRSTNATISTGDTQVGTDAVAALAAGRTSSEAVSLTAPASAGTYYFGACVDAVSGEAATTNNCSSRVTVRVTVPAPDLIVASASVSDSSPAAGATFTLYVSVSNQGDTASAATTLRYYRSTDAAISTADTQVGTDAVAALAAGASFSGSASLTAPASAGTYYFGACVDAVSGEADTTNNCSDAVTVTVPDPAPDLIVTSLSRSFHFFFSYFNLNATVSNQGDTASSATTLRYYRSTDATISTADTQVGTDAVAALAAGASSAESAPLTKPLSPGTHYFGACVDAVSDEADTTNNCSAALSITVAPADLGVGSLAVSPSQPARSAAFTLSATVSNQGDTASSATTLRYYRSTDATISTADTQVGTHAVAALAVAASATHSVALTAPAAAGTYYFGACVDAVSGEAATTNNCSAALTVTVTVPAPDLSVASASVSDSSPAAGAAFTLSASVRNQGDTASSATTLRYYRSTDATISTADTQVGTDAVAALGAGASVTAGEKVAAPATPGTYYFGACVDAVSGEADTTNNCSAAVTVTVP